MLIPKNSIRFYGKENLLASFNHWLMDTLAGGYIGIAPLPADKEFFWAFDYPISPLQTPCISTTEIGLFNLGERALDRLMGHDASGNPVYGTTNQTLIEITCAAQDSDTNFSSVRIVRNLRDRVAQALTSFESIPLKYFTNVSTPVLGEIRFDPSSNSLNEKMIVDPQNQQLKRFVLLVRIFWDELEQSTTTQSINSSARIS